jgi:hypothetical protein
MMYSSIWHSSTAFSKLVVDEKMNGSQSHRRRWANDNQWRNDLFYAQAAPSLLAAASLVALPDRSLGLQYRHPLV